jgi:hypothetical protein
MGSDQSEWVSVFVYVCVYSRVTPRSGGVTNNSQSPPHRSGGPSLKHVKGLEKDKNVIRDPNGTRKQIVFAGEG